MSAHPPFLTSPLPAFSAGMAHGFFSRRGGVSPGLYDSLNCGFGSLDARPAVAENRARAARALGAHDDAVITAYQIHSARAEVVTAPWAPDAQPQADAMVTATPGIALGVLAADCTPILFADPEARVIGAAHAGWKGALAGVAEATIEAMETLGARRERISAAIGPTIRQPAYEVGAEFRERFLDAHAANAVFFEDGVQDGKFQFDLPGYLNQRLQASGICAISDSQTCTYGCPDYFSYRRTTHRAEPDYGRNLSAIMLKP